jgi:hypothetical protein
VFLLWSTSRGGGNFRKVILNYCKNKFRRFLEGQVALLLVNTALSTSEDYIDMGIQKLLESALPWRQSGRLTQGCNAPVALHYCAVIGIFVVIFT